jgi:hypothetical protein
VCYASGKICEDQRDSADEGSNEEKKVVMAWSIATTYYQQKANNDVTRDVA